MPCQSDYLEPSGRELESERVCELIIYLQNKMKKNTPEWIEKAAKDYYGNVARLDEATKILCEHCRMLTEPEVEEYIYDSHNKTARKLAGWWERHQEWDERRVNEEDEVRRKIILKERALKKLTKEEMEALFSE